MQAHPPSPFPKCLPVTCPCSQAPCPLPCLHPTYSPLPTALPKSHCIPLWHAGLLSGSLVPTTHYQWEPPPPSAASTHSITHLSTSCYLQLHFLHLLSTLPTRSPCSPLQPPLLSLHAPPYPIAPHTPCTLLAPVPLLWCAPLFPVPAPSRHPPPRPSNPTPCSSPATHAAAPHSPRERHCRAADYLPCRDAHNTRPRAIPQRP